MANLHTAYSNTNWAYNFQGGSYDTGTFTIASDLPTIPANTMRVRAVGMIPSNTTNCLTIGSKEYNPSQLHGIGSIIDFEMNNTTTFRLNKTTADTGTQIVYITFDVIGGGSLTVPGLGNTNFTTHDAAGGGGTNPLLDDYPGAESAYSIRKLSTSYTGACVKVRGITGGKPNWHVDVDFAFDNDGELSMNSLCTTAGDFLGDTLATYASTDTEVRIIYFYDQSGNGNDLLGSVDTAAPILVEVGGTLSTKGGKAALKFTPGIGADEELVIDPNPLYLETAISHFAVKTIDDDGTDMIFAQGNNGPYYMCGRDGPAGAVDNQVGTPTYYANGVVVGVSGVIDRNDIYQAYATDVQIVSSVLPMVMTNAKWSKYQIFNYGAYEIAGALQELVLYPSDKTGADQTGIEANMMSYYGIT